MEGGGGGGGGGIGPAKYREIRPFSGDQFDFLMVFPLVLRLLQTKMNREASIEDTRESGIPKNQRYNIVFVVFATYF